MARVLVVDDEENIRVSFKEFLEIDEHDVETSEDASDALRLLMQYKFDVVVADIVMPGLSGVNLLKNIRSKAPNVQVILITGEPTLDTATQALRYGAYDYLSKPVSGSLLTRVVRNAARLKDSNDEKNRLELENIRYQRKLEQMVEERTSELKESNVRLHDALYGIITAMSSTVEKRDQYTAGHQVRVAELAKAIAEEMELEKDVVEGTFLAAMIHDIGKISVPAEILAKPEDLTDDEFALIKKHPNTGYEILEKITFPWPIAQIVRQHHERMDGTGYPKGINKDEILLEARILAVADVVESMASHRPYRPQLGIQIALEEIEKHKGQWYDEVIVDACLKLFRDKGYEFTTHHELL